MTDYFGGCDSTGTLNANGADNSDPSPYLFWATYPCVGSGNKTLVELSAWLGTGGLTPRHRLALYSADRTTRIFQTAAFDIVGSSGSWQGEVNAAGLTETLLTGGTNYVLAWAACDSDNSYCPLGVDVNGPTASYSSTHGLDINTNGFPADLSGVTADSTYYMYGMRVGVVDAGGGPVAPTLFNIAAPHWRI